MEQIDIFKTSVYDVPGKTHCWYPVVNGETLTEYKGQPPFTVRAAKKAAAKELGIDVDLIDFTVHK